jgi:hypothetical protein
MNVSCELKVHDTRRSLAAPIYTEIRIRVLTKWQKQQLTGVICILNFAF